MLLNRPFLVLLQRAFFGCFRVFTMKAVGAGGGKNNLFRGIFPLTWRVWGLGAVARKYAHKIPFILKFNHNELLSYPNTYEQILFASIQNAWDMGCIGVGATIYFGSEDSNRQLIEVSEAFAMAHELGMLTILWCYVRNPAFTVNGVNHEVSADLTGQANHLGVTIEADIIKQKQPVSNGG